MLATLASQTPSIALIGSYGRREGLAAWLIATLPGAAMLALLRDGGQVGRVFDALLLACVLPCVYALLQSHGLVAAGGVQLLPVTHPNWIIQPLVTDLGDIPAGGSLSIPGNVGTDR